MTGRLRYALAAAFVALYLLIPAPTSESDRHYLAFLKTRSWLMQAEGPLSEAVQNGVLAPLSATVVPASQDTALQAERQAGYERSAQEWVRARQADRQDMEFDRTRPPIRLEVMVGDDGFQSVIWVGASTRIPYTVNGSEVITYPGRTSLLPAFLAVVLAILTGRGETPSWRGTRPTLEYTRAPREH